MSLSTLPEMIIHLLPGFLGLWAFKRVVQEDIDKRGEGTQIALALLLGMSALALLSAVHALLGRWPDIARAVSPSALTGGPWAADATGEFWASYGVLCLLALASGGAWGWLCEKGLAPTRWIPWLASACLGRGPQTPCESALRALVDEMTEAGKPPSLVRAYPLGGDRDKALIGWWDGYSESEKEIKLVDLQFCEADPRLVEDLRIQPRRCWINHDSGIVFEFLEWDMAQKKGFYDRGVKRYREAIEPKKQSCPDVHSSAGGGGTDVRSTC